MMRQAHPVGKRTSFQITNEMICLNLGSHLMPTNTGHSSKSECLRHLLHHPIVALLAPEEETIQKLIVRMKLVGEERHTSSLVSPCNSTPVLLFSIATAVLLR